MARREKDELWVLGLANAIGGEDLTYSFIAAKAAKSGAADPDTSNVNPTPAPAPGSPPASSHYQPSYRDYLRNNELSNSYNYSGEDEAGNRRDSGRGPISQSEWDALTDGQRLNLLQQIPGYTGGGEGFEGWGRDNAGNSWVPLAEDDPLAQRFRQQFGAGQFDSFELENAPQTGLRMGYDTGRNGVAGPQFDRADWEQLAQDPSRITWLDPEGTENRRYIYEAENQRGDTVAGEQSRHADARHRRAAIAAAVIAAAAGGAALLGPATAGEGIAIGGGATGGAGIGVDAAGGIAAPASTIPEMLPATQLSTGWSSLTPFTQRAILQAAGTGASAVFQGIQQDNAQDFAADQANQNRREAREREDRAAAERANLRTVAPRTVTYTPRRPRPGLVGAVVNRPKPPGG